MMRSRVRTLILTAFLLLSAATAQAESILDHLPDDAIGFVLIRNLAATNAKIEGVTRIFQEVSPMPIPAPLPVLKAATGLGEGLNEQGDALLALLPGDEGGATPRPLLLVAVSDYAAFAASVNGDATGEVCRVTIAGEEILVAKRGSHAVLMNVEHRERLESLLATEPKPLAALEPLSNWLAKTDVAAVLTSSGVDMLTALGQQGLAGQREATEERLSEPDVSNSLRQWHDALEMYEAVLGFLGVELEVAAAGLAIDDHSNLKLLSHALLSNEGELKGVAAPPAVASPLAGFPDQPYVFAAGGPLPQTYGEASAVFMRKMIEANPQSHGFEDLSDEDWKELEESWKAAMQGVTSMSMLIQPGQVDDPLMGDFYSLVHVDDAAAYLVSYKKSMETWNKLLAKTSSDIKLAYETSDVEVAGKQGMLTTVDVGAAANDGNDPTFNAMMEGMFGTDGVMRTYLIEANEKTVLMGMSNEEDVAALLAMAAKGETGLADSPSTQTTLKLLDPAAPWVGVQSPKGTVAWIKRFVDKFWAQLGQGAPTIPEYPDSSPVGFSVNLSDGRLSTEMVWPVDTLEGVAAFIKSVQESFKPPGG